MAARDQRGAQRHEILDDPVMDDGDGPGLMRMRIFFGRFAMGGPPGVADSDMAGQRRLPDHRAQIFEFALGAPDMHRAVCDEGRDPGGVIAAIFQPLQSSDEDWIGVLLSYVPNNSAHTDAPVT